MKHKKIIISSSIIITLILATYFVKNFTKSENSYTDTKKYEY